MREVRSCPEDGVASRPQHTSSVPRTAGMDDSIVLVRHLGDGHRQLWDPQIGAGEPPGSRTWCRRGSGPFGRSQSAGSRVRSTLGAMPPNAGWTSWHQIRLGRSLTEWHLLQCFDGDKVASVDGDEGAAKAKLI
jgi:hypothetical protein